MVDLQLSDSTAIVILGSIAGLYFTITAACSVIICRIWCKKQRCSSKEALKFSAPTKNDYELTEVKTIKDHTDLVPGDRAKKWRQYISNQPIRSNGTSQLNGTTGSHYSQEQPKLPVIEEVGEGVSVWSGEEESRVGVWRREEVQQGMGSGSIEESSVMESTVRNEWMAKRKVKGRTPSTKLLLEETDGSSSWTLTSANDTNGSMLDDMMSSLSLTTSLPGPVLAQCGRPDTHITPIPRPHPRNTHTSPSCSSPVQSSADSLDSTAATTPGHPSTSHVDRDESDRVPNTADNVKERAVGTRKQLSNSTHSLPRHSVSSTHPHPLQKQLSLTTGGEGSGTLPAAEASAGSRPKLRRYASSTPYSSTPLLEPMVLVRPRSRLRKQNSYQSNTLGRSSFPERHSSVTSIEMERNFYTLQTRRGAVMNEGEGRRDKESSIESEASRESVAREDRLAESEIAIRDNTNQKHIVEVDKGIVRMDKNSLAPVIDLGHDGQDSSEV